MPLFGFASIRRSLRSYRSPFGRLKQDRRSYNLIRHNDTKVGAGTTAITACKTLSPDGWYNDSSFFLFFF